MADSTGESIILDEDRFSSVATVIGRIAHDFNNLLTPLLAYPQLVPRELSKDSRAHHLLDIIEKTASDMAHINRQLLVLSAGQEYERSEVNVNTAVEQVCLEVRGTWPELTLEMTLDREMATIEIALEEVAEILKNLIRNAAEATDGKGRIEVCTETVQEPRRVSACDKLVEPGLYARITVRDNGPGLPADIRESAFDPFVTTKKGAGQRGSGLGLSIACRLALKYGGHLDVESSDAGCVFQVSLPLPNVADTQTPSKSVVLAEAGDNGGDGAPCDRNRIMVVDDEKTILRLFQMILQTGMPDVTVDLAPNGAEAVKAFQAGHHAVLLMDLHMPVMDGYAAFTAIQEICDEKVWQMPSVVFCTGFAPPDPVREIVTGSQRHHLLSKPVSGDVLVEAIKSRL